MSDTPNSPPAPVPPPFAPPASPVPPPPPGHSPGETVTLRSRPPRPGEMTLSWRWLTALAWVSVIAALASVWQTSDQLGLSTWWLGPRGEPRPLLVQLAPFVPSVLMVLGAINRVRWLAVWGVVASVIVAAVGVADLGTVTKLGVIEVAVGFAAGAVSIASLTGTYRTVAAATRPADAPVDPADDSAAADSAAAR